MDELTSCSPPDAVGNLSEAKRAGAALRIRLRNARAVPTITKLFQRNFFHQIKLSAISEDGFSQNRLIGCNEPSPDSIPDRAGSIHPYSVSGRSARIPSSTTRSGRYSAPVNMNSTYFE